MSKLKQQRRQLSDNSLFNWRSARRGVPCHVVKPELQRTSTERRQRNRFQRRRHRSAAPGFPEFDIPPRARGAILRRLVAEVIVHAEPNTRGFSIEAKMTCRTHRQRAFRLVPRGGDQW